MRVTKINGIDVENKMLKEIIAKYMKTHGGFITIHETTSTTPKETKKESKILKI